MASSSVSPGMFHDLSGVLLTLVADLSGVTLTPVGIIEYIPKFVSALKGCLPEANLQKEVLVAVNYLINRFVPPSDQPEALKFADSVYPAVVKALCSVPKPVVETDVVVAKAAACCRGVEKKVQDTIDAVETKGAACCREVAKKVQDDVAAIQEKVASSPVVEAVEKKVSVWCPGIASLFPKKAVAPAAAPAAAEPAVAPAAADAAPALAPPVVVDSNVVVPVDEAKL